MGRGAGAGGREARGPEWKEAGPHVVVLNLPPPGGAQRSINKSLSRGGNSGWGSAPSSGCSRGNGCRVAAPAPAGAALRAKYREATTEGSAWPSPVNTVLSTAVSPSHRAQSYCLAPEATRTAM